MTLHKGKEPLGTRTAVCEARVKRAKERLDIGQNILDRAEYRDAIQRFTVERNLLREMLIAEEDHLEYARRNNL